jgi:hypothetical protein
MKDFSYAEMRGRLVAQMFYDELEKIAVKNPIDLAEVFKLRTELQRAKDVGRSASWNPLSKIRRGAYKKQVELAQTEKDVVERAKSYWGRYQKDPEAYREAMKTDSDLPHPNKIQQTIETLGGMGLPGGKRTTAVPGFDPDLTPPRGVRTKESPGVPDAIRGDSAKKQGPGFAGSVGNMAKMLGYGVGLGGLGYGGVKGYQHLNKPKDPYAGQYYGA